MDTQRRRKFAVSYVILLLALARLWQKHSPSRRGRSRMVALVLVLAAVSALQAGVVAPRDVGSWAASLWRAASQGLLGAAQSFQEAFRSIHAVNTRAFSAASAQVTGLASAAQRRVARAQQRLAGAVEGRLDVLTTTVVNKVSDAIIDPEMPLALQAFIRDTLNRVAPEIRKAALHKANSFFSPRRRPDPASTSRTPALPPIPDTPQRGGSASAAERQGAGQNVPGAVGTPNAQPAELQLRLREWHSAALRYATTSRAFILYNLAPADKSFWGSLRNPYYWLLSGVGMIPIPWLSYAWWLLLFGLKTRSDEFQLVDFIIGFETSKFVANGCWGLIQGSIRYFCCTTFPEALRCVYVAPRMSALDTVVFVLQIILVLWAYRTLLVLPVVRPRRGKVFRSRRVGEDGTRSVPQSGARAAPDAPASEAGGVSRIFSPFTDRAGQPSDGQHSEHSTFALAARLFEDRGGAIHVLFQYQLLIISTCVALAIFSVFAEAWRGWSGGGGGTPCVAGTDASVPTILPAALYWIRTLYGLLALPYVAFKLPLVTRLYVTSRFTGYSAAGELVYCHTLQPGAAEDLPEPSAAVEAIR